jgi:cytochrome c
MQLSDQFTLLATPAHLSLVKILLLIMFLLHLPYMGLVIGSSFCSVWLNISGRRNKNQQHLTLARDLIELAAFNNSIGLVLGALPLLVIALIYSQILYGGNAVTLQYLIFSYLPILLGLIAVYSYRFMVRTEKVVYVLVGALGVLLLLAGYLVFIASIARFHDPEKWVFIKNPIHVLIGWHAIGNYLAFLTSSFAITGIGIIFFFFAWGKKLSTDTTEYGAYVKKFGLTIGLIFTLLTPLFIVFGLINLPDIAYSYPLIAMSILLLILLAAVSNLLAKMLQGFSTRLGITAFILALLAFFVMILNSSMARENALLEHNKFLALESQARLVKILPERQMEEGGGITDYAKGEAIYKRICSSCHRFDQKIVGPPYMTVLPKYENDIQKLIAFVSNPYKVNPDYPPMPNQGLKITEAEAVAGYLLKTYQEQYKK